MKTLNFYLLLLSCVFSVNAQQTNQPENAGEEIRPIELVPTSNMHTYKCIVDAAYTKAFTENAIAFVEENFSIHDDYLPLVKNHKHVSYLVTFANAHGFLEVTYNQKGEPIRTRQRFRNIIVPQNIRHELYKKYKGWRMVKNTYKALGGNSGLEKEVYRIKLKKGKKSQIVKIDPNLITGPQLTNN